LRHTLACSGDARLKQGCVARPDFGFAPRFRVGQTIMTVGNYRRHHSSSFIIMPYYITLLPAVIEHNARSVPTARPTNYTREFARVRYGGITAVSGYRRRNWGAGTQPAFFGRRAPYWWSPPLLHPIFGYFIGPCTTGAAAESVY